MQEEWDNSYEAYLNDKLSTVFSVDEYSDDLEERRQLINNIYIEFYSNFGLSVAKNENDEYFFIGEHDIISGKKYEFAMISPGGVAVVKIDGKWLVVNALEEIISEKKYDGVLNFKGKTFFVKLDNKYNLIDNNGKELSNIWFDENTTLDGIPLTEYDEIKRNSK